MSNTDTATITVAEILEIEAAANGRLIDNLDRLAYSYGSHPEPFATAIYNVPVGLPVTTFAETPVSDTIDGPTLNNRTLYQRLAGKLESLCTHDEAQVPA